MSVEYGIQLDKGIVQCSFYLAVEDCDVHGVILIVRGKILVIDVELSPFNSVLSAISRDKEICCHNVKCY
jgi:hypothetical protein